MLNPPVSGSLLIYSAMALLFIGLLMLMFFITRRVGRFIRRMRRRPVERIGFVVSTLRLLLILLLISASTALLFLGAFIQSYTNFTHRELAATVRCTRVPDTNDEMSLEFMTPALPAVTRIRRYSLRGQQWSVEGHILTWDNWLNFFGLRTMYKLTRVRGRYLLTDDEVNKPATAYSLVANEDDPRWRRLYEFGARFPFVQAVYGNTVFTFPAEGKVFAIYVTTSGFMIIEEGT